MADSLVYKLQDIKEDRNTNLKPENLKAGITCLGVTGTLEQNTGSDVEPIYVTSNYTVKTIPVDLNETIDSISTYEDYVAVHTTLNKLKVYNKSDLSTPFITKDNVIPYNQGCYYIYGFEDNKLYITNGFNGSSTQDYYRIDLSKNTITHATYTDSNRLRNSGDLNINMTNNIVHFKHGSYLSIYSYDLTTGFTELSDEYNAVNSYIGNNVYEDLESIVIIQSNGSKTKHRVIPSGGEGAICGVNFTKTKAFLFMSGSDIVVYSLNDDYSMNEMLSTVSLPITFDDGIPKLQCLNSNYYYLSYKDNNYILNFDEETNQFSIVLTNENLIVRNSLPYIENENQYIDFEQGSVEIGITYNNKQYLTRDKYSGYTNTTLLSGHTMYDIAHQLVSGTMPNNGDVTIEPTTEQQTKNSGYYNSLQVNAVTSSIDSNIKPENIKSGISILGVNGTLVELNGHELEVTPSTEQKVIEPEENYNAITRVTVKAVTSAIDSNIVPANIRKGVSILGVEGTAEAGGTDFNEYGNMFVHDDSWGRDMFLTKNMFLTQIHCTDAVGASGGEAVCNIEFATLYVDGSSAYMESTFNSTDAINSQTLYLKIMSNDTVLYTTEITVPEISSDNTYTDVVLPKVKLSTGAMEGNDEIKNKLLTCTNVILTSVAS